ncbi:GDSL-type esterase/lipase family protein [Actinoplanes sp. NPDC049681]|uniref:GDSL-type esterase/lipase family protein n=1 Tax=Actinoplanes sp. NPDC049681 TaxID=3363905 RepID=UPI0037B1E446
MLKRTVTAAAMLLAAGSAFVIAADAGAQTPGAEPARYVALGDSYAAGVGADPYDPASGQCRRSPLGYPRVWAAAHPAYALTDMSCGGATIADVEDTQLGALDERTAMVTVTVGGEDAGFAGTVRTCLAGSDRMCRRSTQIGTWYARHRLAGRLTGLFTEIRRRAPHAEVTVLGYPRPVGADGICPGLHLEEAGLRGLDDNADAVAEALAAAGRRAGFRFADVRDAFRGHESCSSDPWLRAADPRRLTETFHPTAAGYAGAYGAALGGVPGTTPPSDPATPPSTPRSSPPSVPASEPATPPAPDGPPAGEDQVEDRMIELINIERARAGCGPVTRSGTLTAAARTHSRLMAQKGEMSHRLAGEAGLGDRITAAGYRWSGIAENVAPGAFATPEIAMYGKHDATTDFTGFMESEGHRANILRCGYTEVGVGVARDGSGAPWWTQDFGSPR